MRRAPIIAAFVFSGLWSGPASAAVVTRCASDDDGGPGAANLETALAAGGDVTFGCPPGSIIHFNHSHKVSRPTRIDGGNKVTLDGDDHVMFAVENGVTLRFADIAIRRGNESRDQHGGQLPGVRGGVVSGEGLVELLRTTVSNSVGPFWLKTGSIRILASRLEGNKGITVQAPAIEIGGRSRFSGNSGTPVNSTEGSATITDSEFIGNGASTFTNCTLAIKGSTFNANVGTEGGALRINCNATIEKSQFHNNRAAKGGAIYIQADPAEVSMRRVTFGGNIAQETGGAIAVETSVRTLMLTLRSSIFDGNRAFQGGAINLEQFFGNTRFLQGSGLTFKGNRATQKGGAIYAINAGLRIARGAFIENEAVEGGGAVFALQQGALSAEFANSLFAYNRSAQGGSAFQGAAASFIATTIAENDGVALRAQAPLALPLGGTPPTVFPIRFASSIVMGAVPPCGPAVGAVPYTNLGHTIQHPGTSCGGGIPSAYPALGPFFVPLPWSPAVNSGDNAVCQASPVNGRDIYGIKRPLVDNCAIGAAEGDLPRLFNRWVRRNPELSPMLGQGHEDTRRLSGRPRGR